MERFCNGSQIWNTSLTWDNDWPEFTECFQNTVLIWIASGWLWLTSPIYLRYIISKESKPNPITKRYLAKVVIPFLLLILCIVEVATAVTDLQESGEYWKAYLVGPSIETLTLILVIVFVFLERWKGFVTSGVLFIYWTLALITYLVPFYSKIIQKEYSEKVSHFVVFNIYFGLTIIQWILYCFADTLSTPEVQGECPEIRASFLSRITFWWMNGLVVSGYKNPLTEKNIFGLNPREASKNVVPRFEAMWKKEEKEVMKREFKTQVVSINEPDLSLREETSEKTPLLGEDKKSKSTSTHKHKPSLFKVLFKTFGWELLHAQIFKLFNDLMVFAYPLLLQLLVQYVQEHQASGDDSETDGSLRQKWKGYILAVAFFVTVLLQSIFIHQMYHWSNTLGMRVRAALISAVYKKALSMSNQATKESTVGQIVNLMSVDTEHIQSLIPYLWGLWSSPLQIGLALYFLYQAVGYSMFAGLGVLILVMPFNGFIMSKVHAIYEQQMAQKDKRIKLLTEVLNGIKILKLYAWEMSFKEKILAIRNVELSWLWKSNVVGFGFTFTWMVAPYLVTLVTFATYIFTSKNHYLDAGTAFVAISLFNILRFAVNVAPMMLAEVVKSKVSLTRLNTFLNHDDLDISNVTHDYGEDDAISIKDGTFVWDPEIGPCLKSINVSVPEGSIVAVVGQVGSGKSSMLSAALGEMIKVKGRVNVRGSVAYVPQQAWIQNATLQDNILFGRNLRQERYNQVIEACALKPDLDILPAGDLTEIGEKGINLSGGQKQRVSLARAVYHDSDIYYLDDPLSAVDSHVGKHIFEEVIGNTGLLKRKTRILVTHGLQWLPKVDKIIVMVDGCISEVGSYDELLDHAGAFATFLQTYLSEHEEELEEEEDDPEVRQVKAQLLQRLSSITSDDGHDQDGRRTSEDDSSSPHKTKDGDKKKLTRGISEKEGDKKKLTRGISVKEEKENVEKQDESKAVDKLIEEERAQVGSVKFTVFVAYAKALGVQYFALVLFFYGLYHVAVIGTNIWLSRWTEDPVLTNRSLPADSSVYREKNDFYLGIYGALGVAEIVFITLNNLIFVIRTITASRQLHQRMIHNVVRSPMSFFDTTPVGRIVNRFSLDLDTVDSELPMTFGMFMDSAFVVVGTLVVISYSTPFFMTLIIPLGILYFLFQRFYISTSRQLKRLESKTRSPIYNHFGETVAGASVIRAYSAQSTFIVESQKRVDTNQQYSFASNSANRWLGIRLEFLGNVIILAAALFAVIESENISGGIVGLSISYAQQITEGLSWFVRMTSDLETNVVAVERINEYVHNPVEPPLVNENHRPPLDWPQNGSIHFKNYSTRYRPGLDLVLKNIEAVVDPGEKVGIVGRTGAGKSSLTLALFRLIEPAGGSIVIDGENLNYLGLHDFRSRLTILPQEPVLFSGTMRMNLDPMDAYTDEEIWKALEHAHLKTYVQSLPTELEYDCGEGGSNLSVGQRQLLCLARSLLRKTKILILDEATAAVDMETDDLIQETIRTEFKDCTVLTIAHRLNTIMDYDKIMVLDQGLVREIDSPNLLLQNPTGLFYKLAKDAGIV